ncbi:MAG: hypothetical protein WC044_07170 [Crocinitomicaceae bacterium]
MKAVKIISAFLMILVITQSCTNDNPPAEKIKKTAEPSDLERQVFLEVKNTLPNQDFLPAILKQLKLAEKSIYKDLLVVKEIPYKIGFSLVLLPEIVTMEEDFMEFNSHILIVENSTGNIIQKYFESSATNGWASDAVVLREIIADFTEYQVSPENRAFGVRLKYHGSSRANPYESEVISLFIPQGKELKKVLSDIETHLSSGEWDTNCSGEFQTVTRKLNITPKIVNGFYQISFTGELITTKNKVVNGDCVEEITETKNEKNLLTYKNGKYTNK